MNRAAVFIDRDGTLIRDLHFIGKPEQVEVVAGAAHAVKRLNDAEVPVIIVTNQSGIARGFFSEVDYNRVQERTEDLLAEGGARIDASYMCPHHPDYTGLCECRKPATLLFRRAAYEHHLDLARSWYVGDKERDVLPALELGGVGILVPSAETPMAEIERARKVQRVAPSLDAAVDQIIESAR